MTLDIAANRRAPKWTRWELARRLLWELAGPAFRFSPRILWAWRRGMLRLFGARVGRYVHIHPTVRISVPWNLTIGDFSSIGDRVIVYNLGPLNIGRAATISHGAHLCGGTHDYTRADLPLVKSPISIEDDVWICADAFVGPGVTVGNQAIVAARAVAVANVPAKAIVAGNPAKVVRKRSYQTSTHETVGPTPLV